MADYPNLSDEYNAYLAGGGRIMNLYRALARAKAQYRQDTFGVVLTIEYWVNLDDSGFDYKIEITRSGTWKILGESPTPGVEY